MSRVRWENFTQQTDQLVTAMERRSGDRTDRGSGGADVPKGRRAQGGELD